MAEGGAPRDRSRAVGSVAEETARLLDALLGGATATPPTATPGTEPPDHAQDDAPYDGPSDDAPDDPPPAATHDGPHDGAAAADPASVCHLCPVCQLLRVARSVRPETVDRLADLAAMLTNSLREVAASRRSDVGTEEGSARPRPGPDVEDIPLDDPDEDHLDDRDHHQHEQEPPR